MYMPRFWILFVTLRLSLRDFLPQALLASLLIRLWEYHSVGKTGLRHHSQSGTVYGAVANQLRVRSLTLDGNRSLAKGMRQPRLCVKKRPTRFGATEG